MTCRSMYDFKFNLTVDHILINQIVLFPNAECQLYTSTNLGGYAEFINN